MNPNERNLEVTPQEEILERLDRAIERARRRAHAATRPEEREHFRRFWKELTMIREGGAFYGTKDQTNAYSPHSYFSENKSKGKPR